MTDVSELQATLASRDRELADARLRLAAGANVPEGVQTPEQTRDEMLTAGAKMTDWPEVGWEGPQPWEASTHWADRYGSDVPFPGAVTHSEPTLTYGSAEPGSPVNRLVNLLAAAGYADNGVARGTAQPVLDVEVMNDVKRFMHDYRIANDPAEYSGREVPAHELVENHVGPYVWEALYRVANRRVAEAQQRQADTLEQLRAGPAQPAHG